MKKGNKKYSTMSMKKFVGLGEKPTLFNRRSDKIVSKRGHMRGKSK